MSYEDILHDVKLPDDMLDSEFLAPRYGCPTFVVHGILRQYTGWYDGNPSNLFPPKSAEINEEIAGLVGKEALFNHAHKLKGEGREEMALKFLDMAMAVEASPEEKKAMVELRKELLDTLGRQAESFIVKNIYFRARDQERETIE
jgi:alkyl sulfatase BDS1-like metallo-beta-lactamase superfamily hydrolase